MILARFTTGILSSLKRASPSLKFFERFKGGRLERWADYWVRLGRDYQETARTVQQQMKAAPLKSTLYIGVTAFMLYLYHTNPSEEALLSRLVEVHNESSLMSAKTRSRSVAERLDRFQECFQKRTLRRLDLCLFSLAWEDDRVPESGLYLQTVSHLRPRYLTFFTERVLDTGFLGRWWNIERMAMMFDINEDEWDENDIQRPEFITTAQQLRGEV